MSQKNLSSVAATVIDAYGNTARNVISVYRSGGERVIGFVDQRFETVVERGVAPLRRALRSQLIDTQQRLSGCSVKGLHFGAERAHSAVDAAVDLAHKGVVRIAANAERFDQATQLGALEAISRAAMPAAVAMSRVAARIESGSSRLARRVSRQPAVAKAAAKKAATVKPRAVKTTRKARADAAAAVARKPAVRKAAAARKPEVPAAAA